MLACASWLQAIHTFFWQNALQTACHVSNILLVNLEGKFRLEKFSGVHLSLSPKHWHTLWCPVDALHSSLAPEKSILKWDSGARLGIYLGLSSRHACSVALIQNLVSPWFHITFDVFFKTTHFSHAETLLPSAWQTLLDSSKKISPSKNHDYVRKQTIAEVKRRKWIMIQIFIKDNKFWKKMELGNIH